MTQSKSDFLRQVKADHVHFNFAQSPLFAEFFVDADEEKNSWVSPALLDLLAIAKNDKNNGGTDFLGLIHPADVAPFQAWLYKALDADTGEYRLRLKHQIHDWCNALLKVEVVRRKSDNQAELYHGIVVIVDCNLLLAHPQISYSRLLLNAIPDMLFVFDSNAVFLDYKEGKVNDDLIADPESSIGRKAHEVLPDFLADKMCEVIEALKRNEEVQPFEYSLEWKTGTTYYECHMSKLNEDCFLAVIQNNSHHKYRDEMLKEAFDRRRIFIEQAPNAMAMLDTDLRYLAVSNQWLVDYKLEGLNIVGEEHFKIFSNVGPQWKAILAEALNGKRSAGESASYERNDGQQILLKWEIRPWYINDNEIGGVILFTEDITERIRIQKENQKLQALQHLLMKISASFIDLKSSGLNGAINDTLAALGGHVEADRIYMFEYDWNNNTSSNTHEWCAENIDPQIDELQGLPLYLVPEWPEAHKRGEEVYIADTEVISNVMLKQLLVPQGIKSLLTIPLINGDECVGFVGFDSVNHTEAFPDKERELLRLFVDMLVNVQLRIKSRKELTATKAKLEDILKQMNDVIWSLTVPGLETAFLAPSVEKLVGKSAEECAKSPLWWEEFIHPEDRSITSEMFKNLKDKGWYYGEHRIITTTGELKWVRSSGRTIYNTEGRAIRIDAVICDISKQKQNEAQVKSLLDMANDQNERFRNFAHIITHNLRSHTSNLGMLLQLWNEEEDEAQKKVFSDTLMSASNRLGETIDDLNEVVECSTTTDAALRPVHVKKAVEDCMEGLRADILRKEVHIEIEVDKAIKVMAIPAYLESVLHNLVSNAIKYHSPERKPHIVISANAKGEHCVLKVHDNGLGIDLKRHGQKIFGFHKTFHGNEDARGLGLFITKNQVTSMHGRIDVSSKVGEGSIFEVILELAMPQHK